MPNALLPYLHRVDKQHFKIPFILEGTITGSIFRPSPQLLQTRYLDPILNVASAPGRFQVAMNGMCMFAFCAFQTCHSENENWGPMPYNEVTLVIAVADTADGGKLYWFTPLMIVDSFFQLIAGREIYGFPKSLGVMTTQPTRRDVTVEGFSQIGSGCARHLLASLDLPHGTVAAADFFRMNQRELPPERFLEEIQSELGAYLEKTTEPELPGLLGSALQFQRRLFEPQVPGVFLKEFPAIHDSDLCCYRCLTTTKHTILGGMPSIQVHFGAQLKFEELHSNPLASSLGMPGSFRPLITFTVSTRQRVEPGSELP